MKKIFLAAVLAALLFSVLATAVSAAFLGSGTAVLAKDVTLIKSALYGQTVRFNDADVKCALGITDFCSVKVESLPPASEGVLLLGDRAVGVGQTVRRRNVSRLTFVPADDSVGTSSFSISAEGGSGDVITCIIRFTDKINYEPKIDTDATETLSVTTQSGIGVYGSIPASDPEGDELFYMVVKYPKNGALSLDSSTGDFVYTPKRGYDGKDEFVFVVRDEYGNYTEASTVRIKVTDRLSEVDYIDMESSRSYNAAVAMTAMGIMSGKRVGDDIYFLPSEGVTRAEFVAMAMKALGIKADTTLTATYFDDNAEIPSSLVSYVATAARCGIVNGAFDGTALNFRPSDAITFTEAAIVLSNIIEISGEEAVFAAHSSVSALPIWARAEVGAVISVGIFDTDAPLTDAMTREDVAECLYRAVMLVSGK